MGEEGTGEKMQGGEVGRGCWRVWGGGGRSICGDTRLGSVSGEDCGVERLGRALQAPLPALPGHRLHPTVVGGLLAFATPFAAAVTARTRVAGGRGKDVWGLASWR
jgi:hypothetical protein